MKEVLKLSENDIGKLIVVSKSEKRNNIIRNITYKGYLISFNDNLITLKLIDNGYNISIRINKDTKIELEDKKIKLGKIKYKEIKFNPKLPNISYIGTGGTIGTRVDYKTGGVYMCMNPKEIISTTPEIAEIVNIKRFSSPIMKASEDLSYKDWQIIANDVYNDLLNNDIKGIIITHGTDTLSWTGTALSFMLKNVNKPILLIGAQRSPDRASFDGSLNLICAAHFIKEKIPGVFIVMHSSMNDDFCYVIRATKSKKLHTSRRDAFKPVNDVPVAKIYSNGKIEYIKSKKKLLIVPKELPKLDTSFEEKVAIIKAYPNSDPKVIDWYIKEGYKGIVIIGTALGHVPTGAGGTDTSFDSSKNWLPYIEKAKKKGLIIVMSSSCLFGRVNDKVYSNLRYISKSGVEFLNQHDMLPEVTYIKLGIALARFKEKKDIIDFMSKNISGEISEKEIPESFDVLKSKNL